MNFRVFCFCLLCFSVLPVKGGVAVSEAVDNVILLSNGRIEVSVSLVGGRVTSLKDVETGVDYVRAPAHEDSPAGTGLFSDRILSGRGGSDKTPERRLYRLVDSGVDTGGIGFVKIERTVGELVIGKRITLRKDERGVRVDYALRNCGPKSFTGSFWSCSLGTPGGNGEGVLLFPDGKAESDLKSGDLVSGYRFDPARPVQRNLFLSSPKSGRVAWIGLDGRALLFELPYPVLKKVYSCVSSPAMQKELQPTVEWFSDDFSLRPYSGLAAFAATHPELSDPESLFTFSFSMRVEMVSGAEAKKRVKTPDGRPKDERFLPRLPVPHVFTDWETHATAMLKNPARRLRVLVLGLIGAANELAEFRRRFECDMEIAEYSCPHVLMNGQTCSHYSWEIPDAAASMENALKKDYDVILAAGIFEKILPKHIRDRIVSQVERGAGFVYVSPVSYTFPSLVPKNAGMPFTPPGIPYGVLPFDLDRARISSCGKGTVILVQTNVDNAGLFWTRANNMIPHIADATKSVDGRYADWTFAYYGKIIRRAANVEPRAEILSVGDETMTVLAREAGTYGISREYDGCERPGKKVSLVAGTNHVPLARLPLPPNRTVYDVARIDGEDWFIRSLYTRGVNGFDAFSVNAKRYSAGAAVRGSFEARGKGVVRISLADAYGRCLARREIPAGGGGRFGFDIMPSAALMSDYAVCRAAFVVDGNEVDTAECELVLDGAPERKLNFLLWDASSGAFLARPEVLRDIGLDVITVGSNPNPKLCTGDRRVLDRMKAGFRIQPLGMCSIRVWKIDSRERKPCLRDPALHEKVRKDVASTVERFGRFRPHGYTSGDENSIGHYDSAHDMCVSPHCLAAFRTRMREKYRTVDALNEAWGTSFADFGGVIPDSLAEARARGRFLSWFEHRLFMMDAIPAVFATMKDALRREDPTGRLSVSGQLLTGINNCFNWAGTMEYLDDPVAYVRDTDILPDIMRSWNSGQGGGAWIGYGASDDLIRFRYYDQIANGLTMPSFWWGGYLVRRGDGRLSSTGLALKKTLGEIRESGCEELFVGCRAVSPRVAMVFSLPSFVASTVVPTEDWLNPNAWNNVLRGWAGLVRDLGLGQCDALDADKIDLETLRRYEVVVLPVAAVLSDVQLGVLKAYLGQGGRLVVDRHFAAYDVRLRRRDRQPEWIRNANCIVFKVRMLAYGNYRDRPLTCRDVWQKPLRKKLSDAGIASAYAVNPGINYRETRDAGNRYFLVTQQTTEMPGGSVIPFGGPMHVYDTQKHVYLGRSTELSFKLASCECRTFAALPEKASPVAVVCSRRGCVAELRFDAQPGVPRLYRVSVRVDGENRPEYTRNVYGAGVLEHVFDFGLDVDASRVSFEVLDVFTGEIKREL